MREVENVKGKIEYILGNPVRAGLVVSHGRGRPCLQNLLVEIKPRQVMQKIGIPPAKEFSAENDVMAEGPLLPYS